MLTRMFFVLLPATIFLASTLVHAEPYTNMSMCTREVAASQYSWLGSRCMNCQRQPEGRAEQVRASQYCDFLNQTAAGDPDHLYDDAMSTDPEAACVLRLGKPGHYHYEVIARRENFPITYINGVDQKAFCEWTQVPYPNLRDDLNLACNQTDFCIATALTSPSLILDDHDLSPSESRWDQWEPKVRNILIAASLFYFGYKIIKGCNASPVGEAGNMPSIRPAYTVQRQSLVRTRVMGPLTDSSGSEVETAHIALEHFHNESINLTRNENKKSFHRACIIANQQAVKLEIVEGPLNKLNEKANNAKEAALKGVYRYGAVYIIAHTGSLALDLILPGSSFAAHGISEAASLFSNHPLFHSLASEGLGYAAEQTPCFTIGRLANSVMAPDEAESKSSSQQPPVTWPEWMAGRNATAAYRGVQEIKATQNDFPTVKDEFLKTLRAYEQAILKADSLYATAVKEKEARKQRWWKRINLWGGKPTQRYTKSNISAIPAGVFSHTEKAIYYRLYAEQAKGSDQELDKIGAHLLDRKPIISPDKGILIQEVHVPSGTRLQQLNFTSSSELQSGSNQYRLLDIISEDCFRPGVRPSP